MISEAQRNSKQSIGSLLSGIISDTRDLFVQELKLAKKELGEDVKRTRTALTALGIGLVILAMSLGLLLLMLVHLISATTPIPLWGCYGIVGVVAAILGAAFLVLGKNRAKDVDFTPQETANAVKEDVGWIRARVTSSRSAKERGPLSLRR
ncbi:MAG: phage holin family protein [Candidatus Binatia bacterium]